MKIIEKIIIVIYDKSNVTIVKKYKDLSIGVSVIEIDKLSTAISLVKQYKIPIFLFFANNNDQQQIYCIEEFPVISYLNLQMLLKERIETRISNHDLKESVRVDKNKQKYLFIAANVENFWKNFIKMTSNNFIGIGFLALEAQYLVKNLSIAIDIKNPNDTRMQLLMFYAQKNQIQYLIFIDYVIHKTGFITINGISDKIIEGHVIQNLKDIYELFKEYARDAYIIMPYEIKQSLFNYNDELYENIIILTPYEVSIITNTDKIVNQKSRFAELCFIGNILNNNNDFVFNIYSQKISIKKQKQNFLLNLSSLALLIFLCISSVFFYFQINDSNEVYQRLLKNSQRLEGELKEAKDILLNHDSRNKEKILMYKYLISSDTSPIEQLYNLKKKIKIQSLEWESAEIHEGKRDILIKIIGSTDVDKSVIEKDIMENFNNYDLTTVYNSKNNEIEISLKHK